MIFRNCVINAFDGDILTKRPEIRWYYIGHIQINKLNKIIKAPNIWMIETVDSKKSTVKLDNGWRDLKKNCMLLYRLKSVEMRKRMVFKMVLQSTF